MKQQIKWLAVVAAVASGLMAANSLEAQGITGGSSVNNVMPSNTSPDAEYRAMASASFSDVGTGLNIAATGEGAFYYVLPGGQVQSFSAADTEVVMTFTVNGSAAGWYMGSTLTLNGINGDTGTYGGYSGPGNPGNPAQITWNGSVCTETYALTGTQLSDTATGGQHIYSILYDFDPATTTSSEGPYNITLNSINLTSAVPEPTTLTFAGLGIAGFLAVRRRK
jgi:hypothetical protein